MKHEITIDKEGDMILQVEEESGTEMHLEKSSAGLMGGFAKAEIMGVPIGAAGVGLLTVSAWDALRGLVGGALPAAIPQWLIPAIGAVVVQSKMIKGFMGPDAANAAGIILTADAIQALFNVRGLVSGLVGGVKLGQTKAIGGGETNQSIDEYLKAQGLG